MLGVEFSLRRSRGLHRQVYRGVVTIGSQILHHTFYAHNVGECTYAGSLYADALKEKVAMATVKIVVRMMVELWMVIPEDDAIEEQNRREEARL
jgi:hypothetical protein